MTRTGMLQRLGRPHGRPSFFLALFRGMGLRAGTLILVVLFCASRRLPMLVAQPPGPAGTGSRSGEVQENLASGVASLRQQNYAVAKERFEAVLAVQPDNPRARSGELEAVTALALKARAAGSPYEALGVLQRARVQLPRDPVLLTRLGIQAQQMHLLSVASEALAAALAIDPKLPDALYASARVEIDQDRLQVAEAHLRAYLEQRPGDASAHFGLGHVLERQQKTDAARAEFKRSIELKPAQTESYFQLGQMALDVHQDDTARSYFHEVLARDPAHGGALTGDGIAAYRRKEFTVARERLSAAVAASPDYQPAHYYLGLTLARLGEKVESDRQLQLAVDLDRRQQGKGEAVGPAGRMP